MVGSWGRQWPWLRIAGFRPYLRLSRRDLGALVGGPLIRRSRYVMPYVCPGCKSSNRHRLLHGTDFAERVAGFGDAVTAFRGPGSRVAEPYLAGEDAIFLAAPPA